MLQCFFFLQCDIGSRLCVSVPCVVISEEEEEEEEQQQQQQQQQQLKKIHTHQNILLHSFTKFIQNSAIVTH